MSISLNRLTRIVLLAVFGAALAAAIALTGGAPRTAQAADVCPDGRVTTVAPDVDSQVFDVEGKIGAYDVANRTITANGMTFKIPAGLLIKTEDLDQATGNISLEALTDPAHASIVGSTAIASGTVTTEPIQGGVCVKFVANSVYVEPAEHGVVGPLLSVNTADQSFVVGGTTVKINTDSRYPQKLIDLAGTQLTLEQLSKHIGVLVDAVGYFDEQSATLNGTVVEADMLTPQATTDTVQIDRANWKSTELRVRGAVSQKPDGSLAASVDLYNGGVANGKCTGVKLATTAVTADAAAGEGTWEFRIRSTTNPRTVCIQSLGGGVAESAVVAG
jgi:hypothetical protein